MKIIDKNTFGKTPAAEHLVRVLNDMTDNTTIVRSVGRRITGTKMQTKELVQAYQTGEMTAKTVANMLRLMRLDIADNLKSQGGNSANFYDKLTANVQIGYIKQGIRLCQIARKAKRVMDDPNKRGFPTGYSSFNGLNATKWSFIDNQSNAQYLAGVSFSDASAEKSFNVINVFAIKDSDTVTPEILHERSLQRCKRLKKQHMV